MHAPIEPKHPFCRFPIGQLCLLHLHNHIEDSDATAIGCSSFAQGGSHGDAFLEASHDALRQGDLDWLFAPLPPALLSRKAEKQGSRTVVEIKGKAVRLKIGR